MATFARKKRRIGTSYACDGSDLPDTEDLGTSVVSGPFESAPTVPATIITYTPIGYTPCGGTVRRISTKTYSLTGPTVAAGGGYYTTGSPANLSITISARTPTLLYDLWYSLIPNGTVTVYWNICPAQTGGQVLYFYGEMSIGTTDGSGNVTVLDNYMQNTISGTALSCANIALRGSVAPLVGQYHANGTAFIAILHQAYYLNVSEVLTYDLV